MQSLTVTAIVWIVAIISVVLSRKIDEEGLFVRWYRWYVLMVLLIFTALAVYLCRALA